MGGFSPSTCLRHREDEAVGVQPPPRRGDGDGVGGCWHRNNRRDLPGVGGVGDTHPVAQRTPTPRHRGHLRPQPQPLLRARHITGRGYCRRWPHHQHSPLPNPTAAPQQSRPAGGRCFGKGLGPRFKHQLGSLGHLPSRTGPPTPASPPSPPCPPKPPFPGQQSPAQMAVKFPEFPQPGLGAAAAITPRTVTQSGDKAGKGAGQGSAEPRVLLQPGGRGAVNAWLVPKPAGV